MRLPIYFSITCFFIAFVNSECLGNTKWNTANAAYADGKYEEAKVNYIQLVDSREYSSELFYNLGDA